MAALVFCIKKASPTTLYAATWSQHTSLPFLTSLDVPIIWPLCADPFAHHKATIRPSIVRTYNAKDPPDLLLKGLAENGGYLLSHGWAVPSARAGLTSLFGMGRGGTPPL